jgi:hypothetical protein
VESLTEKIWGGAFAAICIAIYLVLKYSLIGRSTGEMSVRRSIALFISSLPWLLSAISAFLLAYQQYLAAGLFVTGVLIVIVARLARRARVQ